MPFRWNDWNLEHATKHGVTPEEAEMVADAAKTPYPEEIGQDKWIVCGKGIGGRFIQVIYVIDPDGETFYIIHARPMTQTEKKRLRRRLR
jgi:uncharacterized DUF497 family protein